LLPWSGGKLEEEYDMDRRNERDRGERGWSREWGNDRNREGRSFRDDDDGYGEGQREFGGSREGRQGGEMSDHPYRGRSSSYYGALGYGDRNEQRGGYGSEQQRGSGYGYEQRGGYGNDPYQQQGQQYGQQYGQQSGERWGGRGQSGEFGDRPFRSSGSESNPAYFGTGGYYGGFSGGNVGRDEWGGRFGEGRYRDTGIEEDRLGEFRRGESWRAVDARAGARAAAS
jgi:23S rRNA pseudouridine2605 synthase